MHEIPIDAGTDDLRFLLDCMTRSKVPRFETWDACTRVFALCDKFECDLIVKRVLGILEHQADLAPWQIFCLASHYGRPRLAKEALEYMGQSELTVGLYAIPSTTAAQCEIGYLLALLKAHTHTPLLQIPPYGDDWSLIADKFQPVP